MRHFCLCQNLRLKNCHDTENLFQDTSETSDTKNSIAPAVAATDIAEYRPHEEQIVRLETSYAKLVVDCSTSEGLANAKEVRVDIRDVRYALANSMGSMTELAGIMAGGKTTLPKHFHGNTADCMAVIMQSMQSMQWGMNPFQVAQKTFIVNGGQLSYEAQLVNAVITTRAPTLDRIHYEWFGDWDKIIGNFREIESKKQKAKSKRMITGIRKSTAFQTGTSTTRKGLVWRHNRRNFGPVRAAKKDRSRARH